MTTNFEDIKEFHTRYKLNGPDYPVLMTDDLFKFRMMFMTEELHEFQHAHQSGDLPQAVDALVDLVYIALGTAYLMGVPWQQVWSIVHQANMRKMRADENNPSERSADFDVVKPQGWRSPNEAITHILWTLGGRC